MAGRGEATGEAAGARGDDRAEDGDAEAVADLAAGGGDGRGHASLGTRHASGGHASDRGVDQTGSDAKECVGREKYCQRCRRG